MSTLADFEGRLRAVANGEHRERGIAAAVRVVADAGAAAPLPDRSGRLRDSLSVTATPAGVSVSFGAPYAQKIPAARAFILSLGEVGAGEAYAAELRATLEGA